MSIYPFVKKFLNKFCPLKKPLLLALSGGSDSLCLFYLLLKYSKEEGTCFHIAHVDHGWRSESRMEAESLRELALKYDIPFHLKTLDPTTFEGNLEDFCREERYTFFGEVCKKINSQGVLTGHHQDDQAETILKRILEGSHWSRWKGLQAESWLKGVRILRPLREISKQKIKDFLRDEKIKAFEDPTNHHLKFLRARIRGRIFPWLNQEFGKQVQGSCIQIAKEAEELTEYFTSRLSFLLYDIRECSFGFYLDLQNRLPDSLIELKYLLRLLSSRRGFFLSREIIEKAAISLQNHETNRLYMMGKWHIWIDRCRIFGIQSYENSHEIHLNPALPGVHLIGNWCIRISEETYVAQQVFCWKDIWKGKIHSYLPLESYMIGLFSSMDESKRKSCIEIKKRWSQADVPLFLRKTVPLIWNEGAICHEFLSGHQYVSLQEGQPCLKIELFINTESDERGKEMSNG